MTRLLTRWGLETCQNSFEHKQTAVSIAVSTHATATRRAQQSSGETSASSSSSLQSSPSLSPKRKASKAPRKGTKKTAKAKDLNTWDVSKRTACLVECRCGQGPFWVSCEQEVAEVENGSSKMTWLFPVHSFFLIPATMLFQQVKNFLS